MKQAAILFTLFFGLTSTALLGQARHYNSMSIGMGGGGTAYVDGYHANFVNPANLMLKIRRQKNTIGIVGGLGVDGGGSLANISVYNKYLTTGLMISGETRENMLNEWFGSSSENFRDASATVNIVPFGFAHRSSKYAFSLATRMRVSQDFAINKGMAELLTYGLDSEVFGTPTPVSFKSNSVAFAEISIGYAMEVLSLPNLFFANDVKLYVGAAPKYLYGIYTNSLDFTSQLHMQEGDAQTPFTIHHQFEYDFQSIGEISDGLRDFETARNNSNGAILSDFVNFNGDDFASPQAKGFGLDLGGTLEMDISTVPIPLFLNNKKTLRLSMSVTDIGKLSFDQSSSNVHAQGEFSYSGAHDEDNFDTFFENLQDSLENDVYGNFNSDDIDAIAYSLPAMYNFGTSLEMGKLLLALDYGIGFNDNGSNSRRSVLNLGAQYKLLGFLPLRVGTRVGGYSSMSFSAGAGLDFDFLEFTIGASSVKNSEKNGSSVGAAWSGLVVRF